MDNAIIEFLSSRRSAKPQMLAGPGPSSDELSKMLTIAARVPDHKKVVPWRFIVFEGDARQRMGDVFAQACRAEDKMAPSEIRLETERQRFMRAPLVIAVVSRVKPTPGAPEWEQILSAGAASFNLCLAANALGYQTCWITEWIAYSAHVRGHLGLADNERVAGFVYIGRAGERQPDRERPRLEDVVTRYGG